MKKTNNYTFLLCFLSTIFISCEKLLEIPESKSQIETTVVFSDSTIAASALLNIYSVFATGIHPGSKYLALYTDEYFHTAPGAGTLNQFNQSILTADNNDVKNLWASLYSCVYQTNALLEGLEASTLSLNVKKQLGAEAKFLRAFANFYLINIFGRVPLIMTTNVNTNRHAYQNSESQVYAQIVKDLKEAQSDLSVSYISPGKVRANSLVASALLARVFLYQGLYQDAEKESSAVIGSGSFTPLPAAEEVFYASSRETILQFWTVNGFVPDVSQMVPSNATSIPAYTVSTSLYKSYSITDNRKNRWIGTNSNTPAGGIPVTYYYPAKYKNRTTNTTRPEYVMALRLGEQYLIRAEAYLSQGNVPFAIKDLNVIRQRAGLISLPENLTPDMCLEVIESERRQELVGEWGHRFFDLKRWGRLDQVMTNLKTNWTSSRKNWPIPATEIIYNNNLTQNDGY